MQKILYILDYAKAFDKIRLKDLSTTIFNYKEVSVISVLAWHLDFSDFPKTGTWLLSVFSINTFIAVALMNIPPFYLDGINLSLLLDW